MKLKAYVLAADPNWIEASVLSYYPIVDEIVVSYDQDSRSWTGQPLRIDECLERLRSVDRDKKMTFFPGKYYRADHSPIENDTFQRQEAINFIGDSADWILEFDTDEICPNPKALIDCLTRLPKEIISVEWPMRVFFQRTAQGRFLEVTTYFRQQMTEYPGCIATRPGVKLTLARHTAMKKWRVDVRATTFDPHQNTSYTADEVISPKDAVLHFSWVRTDEDILRKVAAWGHATDFEPQRYYQKTWKRSLSRWPFIYNFHPIWPKRWQALWPVKLPKSLFNPTDRKEHLYRG